MSTTRSLVIPGEEWEQVRKRITPHASSKRERRGLNGVQLEVRFGDRHRHWAASDSFTAARMTGGRTEARPCQVFLPLNLFSPFRPRPSSVEIFWNTSRIWADSPQWNEPREGGTQWAKPWAEELVTPKLHEIFDEMLGREHLSVYIDFVPTSSYKDGQLPLVLDTRSRVLTKVGKQWWKIGNTEFHLSDDSAIARRSTTNFMLLCLNDKLTKRCLRSIEPDDEMRVIFDGRRPVLWTGTQVTCMQMPMATDAGIWFRGIDEYETATKHRHP